MKNTHLLITFICLITTYSFGQINNNRSQENTQFGIKIGTNYSNVYDTKGDEFKADPKFGLATGIFLSIPIGRYLGIQPEVLFSQKGFKAEGNLFGSTYALTHTSNYIDIPLLISIKPIEYLSVLAGPQYSYLISHTNKFKKDQTSIEQEEAFDNENIRKNMFSFTGGIDININPIVISGRVGLDLFKNIGNGTSTTLQYKNVLYQFALGYRF